MLGQNVVAVKGMHNHPPRALCLPSRKQTVRKQLEANTVPIPPPITATASLEALALQAPKLE